MLIRSVEEIATGVDEVIGEEFRKQRLRFGASLEEVAQATGASLAELSLIENGDVGAFADIERLRLVILAFSDYLDLDAAPLLARLEIYAPRQKLVVPTSPRPDTAAARRLSILAPMVIAAGFAALFAAGWLLVYVPRGS